MALNWSKQGHLSRTRLHMWHHGNGINEAPSAHDRSTPWQPVSSIGKSHLDTIIWPMLVLGCFHQDWSQGFIIHNIQFVFFFSMDLGNTFATKANKLYWYQKIICHSFGKCFWMSKILKSQNRPHLHVWLTGNREKQYVSPGCFVQLRISSNQMCNTEKSI